MRERFVNGLNRALTVKQAVFLLAFCLLFALSFAVGAVMGSRSVWRNAPDAPPRNAPSWEYVAPDAVQTRGTFGAIDAIQGNVIRLREPRTGRTWKIRAGRETVIQMGPRQRVPLKSLRVGQRIFVVGVPNKFESHDEFDAQFIGVVLGQQQRFVRPAAQPVLCWECVD